MDTIIKIIEVAIPRPIDGLLTYSVTDELAEKIQIGSIVEVPFRSKNIYGFVTKTGEIKDPASLKYKIKPATGLLLDSENDRILFSEKDLKFFSWISEYYQIPLGEVFYSAFPKALFSQKKGRTAAKKAAAKESLSAPKIQLTDEQTSALQKITNSISSDLYRSFLLYGVTGSGKTEVYIRSAEHAVAMGKTVLILVPEIALTPQLRIRFEERFHDNVAVLHSGLSEKARREYWWDILNGKKTVVVGARSALFAPLKNIGLIVVDEEHEPTYKQEDRLRYNARDLALVRAGIHSAAVVLGSATPSIETYYSALKGKHELLELKTRPLHIAMPTIEVIDLKKEIEAEKKLDKYSTKKIFLSNKMIEKLNLTFEQKHQSILFVNRKGFSNFILCKDCGHVPECLNCSVSLTYYQKSGQLKCHYCDFQHALFDACPKCSCLDLLFMGMGTELIEEQVKKHLPNARVERLDADVANSAKKIEAILTRFRNGEIDILVGTQMLAKGHDFPNVTFVGVVLADSSLHFPDFRANERTFQLLTQVAGRAGRGEHPGTVLFQTFVPEHYVIQAASEQSFLKFYNEEIEHREIFGYPPFSKIAQIEFRHLNEPQAKREAETAKKLLEHLQTTDFQFLGPSAASIAKVANKFRYHILLKAEKSSSLNSVIKTLRKNGIRWIDVDPVSTL